MSPDQVFFHLNPDLLEMSSAMGSADHNMDKSMGTFWHNFKRQTGTYFDEEAMSRFNVNNGTTHLLRAHEAKAAGFDLTFGGTVVTVFSSSAYQKNDNVAAVLFVQDDSITPVQIET